MSLMSHDASIDYEWDQCEIREQKHQSMIRQQRIIELEYTRNMVVENPDEYTKSVKELEELLDYADELIDALYAEEFMMVSDGFSPYVAPQPQPQPEQIKVEVEELGDLDDHPF